MSPTAGTKPRAHITSFRDIQPVACPCGWARRAFAAVEESPGTVHLTEITEEAQTHYHKRITETYVVLECEPEARMELDGKLEPVHEGSCVLIPPGVRHRFVGKAKVIIVAVPKFDPADEWFD
jgi:mannose-6-phosphate isomerase-like protein (cupin superfamily)